MLYMLVAYRPPDKDVYYSTKQRNHIKPASCLGFVVFLQSELSKEMHQLQEFVKSVSSCLSVSPQKRKRREKDDSDAVSLCSFDFKVKHIITHSVSLVVRKTPFHALI